MRRRGDPVENLKKGILFPIFRSFAIVALVFILAIASIPFDREGRLFFGVMFGSVPLLWLYEKSRKAAREEERRASREFFGLDNE